ncbi:MAG: cytochrome C556 [Rhizobiales bacterium]|nr:cytochrome C556 [Hyphomicrobiales bacterium]MBA68057.1 cytochrome C556 [Hyphomicrobiales bacterium]|tara:strand:+ start:109 stop:555 length:447 start_codon:yes stop_codon:yes gene_type:complete
MKFRTLITAATFGLTAVAAAYAAEPQEMRQEMMKHVGGATGAMAKMVKGEDDFDQAKVIEALTTISKTMAEFPAQFPEGTETGMETEAAPAIWENKADFEAKAIALKDAADAGIASPPSDVDGLKAMFGPLTKNCGSCHETYRLKKEG